MNPNSNVSLFNFKDHDLRVVEIDGEPWFIAVDVYSAIALKQWGGILNPLSDDEKCLRGRTSVGLPPGRDIWTISESGLYKLVMRSDKPEAKAFQDWATKEVLPSIRKHGGYILGQENMTTDQFLRAVATSPRRRSAGVRRCPTAIALRRDDGPAKSITYPLR